MNTQERIVQLSDLNNGILLNLIIDNNPLAVANKVMNITGAKGDVTKDDVFNVWQQYHDQGNEAVAWSIFDVPYLPGNGPISNEDHAAIQTLINLNKNLPRPQMLNTNGGPAGGSGNGGSTSGGSTFDLGSIINGFLNNAPAIIGAVTGAVNGAPSQTPGTQTQAPPPPPAADNTSKYLMYGGIALVAVAAIAIGVAAFRKKKS